MRQTFAPGAPPRRIASKSTTLLLLRDLHMTSIRTFCSAVMVTLLAMNTYAATPVDELSTCLSENTNGKDRKLLAKWVFVSMAAHPDMSSFTQVTQAISDETLKAAGLLLTRLLADSCPKETQGAVKAVGPIAIQTAFTVVGQLAFQELMTDKNVLAVTGELQRHMDMQRLAPIVHPK